MTKTNETPSDLEEVSRFFTHTCSVCGKNTQVDKNYFDELATNSRATAKLHFSGCARIGMPTYW